MRLLGYPRPLPADALQEPDFGLVAACLRWLVLR